MSQAPAISALPTVVHLLPVKGFVLLPGAALPLSLPASSTKSIQDLTKSEGGWIGVVQGDMEGGRFVRKFDVGCLGHFLPLASTEETQPVIVEGLIRFRVREDLGEDGGTARVRVDYEEFAHDVSRKDEDYDQELGWDKETFKEKLVGFAQKQFGNAGILEAMTPHQLVRFMAQTLPLAPAERQALLEARDFPELLSLMMQLLAISFLTTTPDPSHVSN